MKKKQEKIKGQLPERKAEHSRDEVNHHILNIITPPGIDFDNIYTNLGENVGKIYALTNTQQKELIMDGYQNCAIWKAPRPV